MRQRLHCSDHVLKYAGMLMFTAEGPRSVDDRDVIAVYRDHAVGGYCQATVIMASGAEISGRVLVAAIDKIRSSGSLPTV